MSLAERLAEIDNPPPRQCKFARFVDRLREQYDDPEQVDEWLELVVARRVTGPEAAEDLREELGETISADSVQKHLRGSGRCGCTA